MIEVKNYLPQRYPFLMVDRVKSIDDDEIIGFKNLSYNEPFFQGHFPDFPIMPGVLTIEALAQLSGILIVHQLQKINNTSDSFEFLLVGIDKARFKKQVIPGDQLMLYATLAQKKGKFFGFKVHSKVDGHVTAKAEVLLANVTDSPA